MINILRKRALLLIILAGFIFVAVVLIIKLQKKTNLVHTSASYHDNIVNITKINSNFRRVLFTGLNSQLVIMNIPPGGEVGAEVHKYTEQTLFFLSGTGEGELNKIKFSIIPGDVVVVEPGTEHNFWNTGKEPLKIYTIYAPSNHLPGLVEATKTEADANTADEAVGNKPPAK